MKSGLTKGETTCKYVRKGQTCRHAGQGCPFNHKKPKAAAPAQPVAGTKSNAAPAQNKNPRGRSENARRPRPKGAEPFTDPYGGAREGSTAEKSESIQSIAWEREQAT
eukprot:5730659-Pyramimonas_sp.AAC.1